MLWKGASSIHFFPSIAACVGLCVSLLLNLLPLFLCPPLCRTVPQADSALSVCVSRSCACAAVTLRPQLPADGDPPTNLPMALATSTRSSMNFSTSVATSLQAVGTDAAAGSPANTCLKYRMALPMDRECGRHCVRNSIWGRSSRSRSLGVCSHTNTSQTIRSILRPSRHTNTSQTALTTAA